MMKEFIANILRGTVIGIANVIPGVSGGTMMVSMGIYDKLILVLTHFIKRMKEAVALLVPILVGMLLSIAIFAKIFSEILFPRWWVLPVSVRAAVRVRTFPSVWAMLQSSLVLASSRRRRWSFRG